MLQVNLHRWFGPQLDSSAAPKLEVPQERLAFLTHRYMINMGLKGLFHENYDGYGSISIDSFFQGLGTPINFFKFCYRDTSQFTKKHMHIVWMKF